MSLIPILLPLQSLSSTISFPLPFQILSLSWHLPLYIPVSSSPEALPLFYTYMVHSVKQRSFTVNPFERVTYTHCFLLVTTLWCKPFLSGLCPQHQRNHMLQGCQCSPNYQILGLFSVIILPCLSIVSDITDLPLSMNCSFPWLL